MILLLDAHALLWWLADDPQLASSASRSIADPASDVLVSAATVWEIEVKRVAGRLRAPAELAVAELPTFNDHKDPFDRMLVAQAQRLDALIVSRDPALTAYGVDVLPA